MPTALPSRSWVAGGVVALLRHAAAARVATCRASAVTRFRNTSLTPAPQESGRCRMLFRGARRDGVARNCPLARSAALRDKLMTNEHFEELKADVVEHMIAQVHENQLANGIISRAADDNESQENIKDSSDAYNGGLDEDELMFRGMDRLVEEPRSAVTEDETTIKVACEKELEIYLRAPALKLKQVGGSFTDPLAWWNTEHVQKMFPILAPLAQMFLAIPATSAPSERMWNRGASVLTAKRNRFAAEVTSSTMFLKENVDILRKHYEEVVKGVKDPVPLYLPELVEAKETKVDVGGNVFDVIFQMIWVQLS